MPTPTSSRLAARLSIRQVEALAHADALADAVDRAVLRWWTDLFRNLREHRQRSAIPHATHLQLSGLQRSLTWAMSGGLAKIADWAHDSATDPLRHALPDRWIRSQGLRRHARRLREDANDPGLRLTVPGGDLSEPAERLSKADLWKALKSHMFPAPSLNDTSRIVHAGDWQQRIASASRLADPATMAQEVIGGMVQGANLQEIAKRLKPKMDGVRSSARRVARTEGMRVAHEVQLDAWNKLGDLCIGYQIHATFDQHTRPWHASRSGTIYYKKPVGDQKGLRQMPRPPVEADDPNERPPNTPRVAFNCLLPGNYVQGRFLGGLESIYSGNAVELVCASGASVRVTANHPILSSHGWVAAKSIHEGDHLACRIIGIEEAAEDDQERPALAENVFGALSQVARPVAARPASVDFHGDELSCNGEIKVVRPKRKLLIHRETGRFERIGQCLLVGAGMRAFIRAGYGTNTLAPFRIGSATACLVSRHCLPLPSARIIDPVPLGLFGFGLAAQHNASLDKVPAKSEAAYRKLFRELIQRLPGPVSSRDSGYGWDFNPLGELSCFDFASETLEAGPCEPRPDAVAFHADHAPKFGERSTAKIQLDEVVEIKRFHYEGPVYDMETDVGYHIANCTESSRIGIFVSNCRCFLTPVLQPAPHIADDPEQVAIFTTAERKLVPDPAVYSDWFARQPEPVQKKAVGVRRFNIVADLVPRPTWAHFLDPETGDLMPREQLAAETPEERQERVADVTDLIAALRRFTGETATFGFLRRFVQGMRAAG